MAVDAAPQLSNCVGMPPSPAMDIREKATFMLGQLAFDDLYTTGSPRDIDLECFDRICGCCSD